MKKRRRGRPPLPPDVKGSYQFTFWKYFRRNEKDVSEEK